MDTSFKVFCGVPPGSSLGPDLFKAFVDLNITHFADDTNLCFHAKKIGKIESFFDF